MTNKKLQELIKKAKATLKEFPDFDALTVAQTGELWPQLSSKQQKLVEEAFNALW